MGPDDGRRMSQQQFVLALREKGYMWVFDELQEETLQGIPLKDNANTIHPYMEKHDILHVRFNSGNEGTYAMIYLIKF